MAGSKTKIASADKVMKVALSDRTAWSDCVRERNLARVGRDWGK
jgi:hypothetical protein